MGKDSQNARNNENKGRGLFYIIIAVAVLIIMGIGTTFAYFTATTNSADSSVQAGSTTLRLQYISYEGAWMNRDLIPADTNVVEYSFEYQDDTTINKTNDDYVTARYNTLCKDDYGNSICSVYVFQVVNTANSPQSVSLNVVSVENSFANLNAMGYLVKAPTNAESADYKHYNKLEQEIPSLEPEGEPTMGVIFPENGLGDPTFKTIETDKTEGSTDVRDGDGIFLTPGQYEPVYVNRLGVTKTLLKYNKSASEVLPAIDRALVPITEENAEAKEEDRTVKIADNITIDGRSTETFALVLYIKNINDDQTSADALKSFTGKVIVSSGDGKVGVSGSISVSSKKELQSGNSLGEESGE